jgi:hypothetical protein
MRLSASTRRWLARITAPRKRKPAPGGKRRHSPVERLNFAKPWSPEARDGRGGWKPFIRATMGKSGVYAIKHSGGTYVGSSDSGRLYRTMIRHLEEWTRKKDFWAKQYDNEHGGPGETFDRKRVTVAVIVCPAKQAVALEAELQRRMHSVSNEQSPPGEKVDKFSDKVPF